MTSKFQRPPRSLPSRDEASSKAPDPSAFIASAGQPMGAEDLPWVGLDDTRRTELYNLRLTPSQYAKVRWVADISNQKSMHRYCLNAVFRAVNEDLARFLMEGGYPTEPPIVVGPHAGDARVKKRRGNST